ncbi:AraC family transcriptional regulator [Oceanimonas baumannii]|uniref:helix-turn-helix transcriptional regulator n=1 Tax=Oceanimonas baumannii TaxID=129578 RepID=UPI001D17FE32|nr:AraC family transcriptional regulator [Oceanimonas baumannii]MCC4265928.1 AraC family transcriptional regulator [Oceanimonas baumannii]
MTYRFNAAELAAPSRLGQGLWLRSRLPDKLGDCTTDVCHLDDGLVLAYTQYRLRHDLLERSNMEREGRSLTITIALEGESSTMGVDGQRFDFIAGNSTMAAFSSVRGERRFPAGRAIRQLRLIVSEPVLQRYRMEHLLDGVRNDHTARHLHFGRHGGATQRFAQALVHLHGSDAGVLDLQIATLSLLAEQTRTFRLPDSTVGKLREDDQKRILHARDIMMREFARPLTIAWLCATVGTNEFKLKQGFRELFGTSPHRMLTDIRMQKAWELLETGLHVSTVAYQIGYQHLSSFSAAFERYYGRTPKSVANPCKRP